MTVGLLLLGAGALLLVAGVKGKSLGEALRGEFGSFQNPDTGLARTFDVQAFRERATVEGGGGSSNGSTGTTDVSFSGTGTAQGGARGIVDQGAAIGAQHGCRVVSGYRPNSTTTSGNISDHSQNDAGRAARDISNARDAIQGPPTPEMDATVEAIAEAFGTRVNGKRAVVKTWHWHGYRLQLIYRTPAYGGHMGHVHFGARRGG